MKLQRTDRGNPLFYSMLIQLTPQSVQRGRQMKIWAKTSEFGRKVSGGAPRWVYPVLAALRVRRTRPGRASRLRGVRARLRANGLRSRVRGQSARAGEGLEADQRREGEGDADAAPHRKDDPEVIALMRGSDGSPTLWHETHNVKKYGRFREYASTG